MAVGYPNLPCPNCGGDCETTGLPCVVSNPCIKTWDRRKSEGRFVYLAPYDGTNTPPIDHASMTDANTWLSLIDNDAKASPYIRCFCAVGDLPLPSENTFEYKGESITIDYDFVYNWEIIDVNQTNYDFMRELSCGQQAWMAWTTDGGSLFGWALATIKGGIELARGDSFEILKFTSAWKANCAPPRYDNPLAES